MSDSGTLIVRVYTSQAQIPLQGATVVVASPCQVEAGKFNLISVQITDSSGQIKPITIETPAAGESTGPDGAPQGSEPFAQCCIWAEHPGFVMLQIEGVQIFPGVETMQDIELVPLATGQSSLQERNSRCISAQDL
ncbi:MAG: spore cortex-lytic protein [Lawsonibacter sp.]|nr:spore cortex-lytic protein [Lawsonibacter sp.]